VRTTTCLALLGLTILLAAAPLRAGDDEPAPAAPGATQAEIQRLVADLGADDFRTREAASRKLASIGEPARAALEKALKESESPEVRWRAEQLLRRLAGSREVPLEGEDGTPGARPPEPARPGAEPTDPIERLRRLLDDFTKRRGDPFDVPFGGPLSGPRTVQAPGLVLERTGPGMVELRVRKEKDGVESEDVYHGHSLRDILHRNPELERHAGMAELRRREAEQAWPGFEDFFERAFPRGRVAPFGNGGFSFSTSAGVEITQGADGVIVRIRERDEEGKEQVKEYKGESLEELKRDHPELREKLQGFGFQLRFGPPEIRWPGRERERLKPLPPSTPAPAPSPEVDRERFGVLLQAPEEALASHLGLGKDEGALVVEVRPGTQAAALGLQRNDIVVRIDGAKVGLEQAATSLGAAAASKGPLTVEVVRRGANVTLTR
jgi:hypothetical protein